jgi:mRNA-degrading endonuclease toxin of MazEF toxin-antitoxin module
MTTYRRVDVVLVPFDFTDRSGSKWRPAVVISSDRYNTDTPDVVVASITSNLQAVPHPGDRRVEA